MFDVFSDRPTQGQVKAGGGGVQAFRGTVFHAP